MTRLALLAATLALATPSILAQDAVLARSLAATCANCHGPARGGQPAIPALDGQPAAQILGKLAAFKSGDTPSTIMQQIVKGYTDEQLTLIAGHLAAQKPAR